ncbi:FtsX-like permease family protein [candidate division GN15 bacterium]|nr:FtsX-like permease family protein [candidate division GN15 bacterium]
MYFLTMYNLFVREFRKQRKRILLTLVALTWGTISIMLLLAFGEGLHRQLATNQKGMGENIAVLWGGQTSIPFKGLGKGRPIRLHKEDPEYLRERIPEIRLIGGEYSRWGVRIKYGDNILNEHVTGIMQYWDEMRNHIPVRGGRMINKLDVENKRRVAFIGHSLMNRILGYSDDESDEALEARSQQIVGEQITLNGIPFTVIGVMIAKTQMSNYEGMDEDVCAIPNSTFKMIFGDPWLDNLVYKAHNADDMKLIEKQIFEAMGAKYKFDPTDDHALWIWDTVESSREFNNIMMGIKVFLGIIGMLTLIIAGVGVANIMYVSIKERTREIGIKLAVGARKGLILTQFLIEAMLITFLGGFLGMFISYALTEGFKRVPIESDVLEFMGRPTVSLEIGVIVVVILGIMGILSGFFPALRAASVSPVESLRYE